MQKFILLFFCGYIAVGCLSLSHAEEERLRYFEGLRARVAEFQRLSQNLSQMPDGAGSRALARRLNRRRETLTNTIADDVARYENATHKALQDINNDVKQGRTPMGINSFGDAFEKFSWASLAFEKITISSHFASGFVLPGSLDTQTETKKTKPDPKRTKQSRDAKTLPSKPAVWKTDTENSNIDFVTNTVTKNIQSEQWELKPKTTRISVRTRAILRQAGFFRTMTDQFIQKGQSSQPSDGPAEFRNTERPPRGLPAQDLFDPTGIVGSVQVL